MRSNSYRLFLKDNITSLNHSCDENAAQESFHSLLKKKKLYQIKLYTYEDAYRVFISWWIWKITLKYYIPSIKSV